MSDKPIPITKICDVDAKGKFYKVRGILTYEIGDYDLSGYRESTHYLQDDTGRVKLEQKITTGGNKPALLDGREYVIQGKFSGEGFIEPDIILINRKPNYKEYDMLYKLNFPGKQSPWHFKARQFDLTPSNIIMYSIYGILGLGAILYTLTYLGVFGYN